MPDFEAVASFEIDGLNINLLDPRGGRSVFQLVDKPLNNSFFTL